jgi:hypothetical protein
MQISSHPGYHKHHFDAWQFMSVFVVEHAWKHTKNTQLWILTSWGKKKNRSYTPWHSKWSTSVKKTQHCPIWECANAYFVEIKWLTFYFYITLAVLAVTNIVIMTEQSFKIKKWWENGKYLVLHWTMLMRTVLSNCLWLIFKDYNCLVCLFKVFF